MEATGRSVGHPSWDRNRNRTHMEIGEGIEPGGGDGNRTHDLYVANVAL